jgi:hypothetical protein
VVNSLGYLLLFFHPTTFSASAVHEASHRPAAVNGMSATCPRLSQIVRVITSERSLSCSMEPALAAFASSITVSSSDASRFSVSYINTCRSIPPKSGHAGHETPQHEAQCLAQSG